jgi:hypothetical protein
MRQLEVSNVSRHVLKDIYLNCFNVKEHGREGDKGTKLYVTDEEM